MFTPNRHSFLLVQERRPRAFSPTAIDITTALVVSKQKEAERLVYSGKTISKKIFLPNTDSFILVKHPSQGHEGSHFSVFLPTEHSFQLVWSRPPVKDTSLRTGYAVKESTSQKEISDPNQPILDSDQGDVSDRNKRNFLKAAGAIGAGLVASQMLPKHAEALILGSSPTTGVVGVKNASNQKINPATEETVASLLKTSDLTFDAGALEVKVTAVSGGSGSSSFSDSLDVAKSALVDVDRHVQVDVLSSALPSSASTETTLQTISFGGFKFALRLETVGSIDYVGEATIGAATSASAWRIKRVDSTTGIVIEWAGSGVFDQVWDNRASLSYS